MHSYALQVADIDATIAHLADSGVTVGVRPAKGFCFTDPRTTGGLLFEWSGFTVEQDPRVGAPMPDYTVEPLLDVRTHAFVGAVVADPIEWAKHYGPLFGLRESFRDPGADPGEPMVGLAAPDCILALYRLPGADGMELWGTDHPRARFHVLGLGVGDLDAAADALAQAGVGTVRRTSSSVVIDPHATGDVPLVITSQLLPGDPRS